MKKTSKYNPLEVVVSSNRDEKQESPHKKSMGDRKKGTKRRANLDKIFGEGREEENLEETVEDEIDVVRKSKIGRKDRGEGREERVGSFVGGIEVIECREGEKWDNQHVKMPFYSSNVTPQGEKKWEKVIMVSLSRKMETVEEVMRAIWEINPTQEWNLSSLKNFYENYASISEKAKLSSLFPKMAKLALLLPKLCPKPIPLLRSGREMNIILSQNQIASLLANAFFCTFPKRNSKAKNSEYSNFPTINFSSLHNNQIRGEGCLPVIGEKYRAIFHYFECVTSKKMLGKVSFQRKFCRKLPLWHSSNQTLSPLSIHSQGTIEDSSSPFQVDFANRFIGGFSFLLSYSSLFHKNTNSQTCFPIL